MERRLRCCRKSSLWFWFCVALLFGPVLAPAWGQNSSTAVWLALKGPPQGRLAADQWIAPPKFHAFHLDHAVLRPLLGRAPREFTAAANATPGEIELPMPDGSLAKFRFVESPVMAPELAAKFPEIRTYLGWGVEDPAASVRFDFTPTGFHAQILSPRGAVYIDPLYRNDAHLHASYFKRDYVQREDWQCWTPGDATTAARKYSPLDLARSGATLRTYRLAVAATGEYTAYFGGTVAGGLAAIVTAVNRVTGVYETELAIRLVLVANNDQIVYTDAKHDPYTNNNADSLLNQNQSNLDAVIGDANYDVGHVFSTAGGGLADLDAACVSGWKARGETGRSAPVGDAFYIDFVAHEMGHQFGANHTFNGTTSSCSGNRNSATAYEQGSGSTIMAYAGICGSDNLQPHSDPYFHSISFDEILAYTTTGAGSGCPVSTSTGNHGPTVSAGPNYTIPAGTAFVLTAAGSDPEGDPLSYCWEERDLGPTTAVTAPDNGSSPLFRSWNPAPSPSRTLPRLVNLLNNSLAVGEVMAATTRTMKFRVTARDNRAGGGGVSTADMQVNVISNAGPFAVTSHNDSGVYSNATTVSWDVAGTANPPINAALVNVWLSTNYGQSFDVPLAIGVSNNGACKVTLPDLSSFGARLKVEAVGNIFFAVNRSPFTLAPRPARPIIESLIVTNDTVWLTWTANPGSSYRVQESTNFAGDDWVDWVPDLVAAGTQASATNGAGGGPSRWYRVMLVP